MSTCWCLKSTGPLSLVPEMLATLYRFMAVSYCLLPIIFVLSNISLPGPEATQFSLYNRESVCNARYDSVTLCTMVMFNFTPLFLTFLSINLNHQSSHSPLTPLSTLNLTPFLSTHLLDPAWAPLFSSVSDTGSSITKPTDRIWTGTRYSYTYWLIETITNVWPWVWQKSS